VQKTPFLDASAASQSMMAAVKLSTPLALQDCYKRRRKDRNSKWIPDTIRRLPSFLGLHVLQK
jgi:hypothetical protein